jgi:hypothetical protein
MIATIAPDSGQLESIHISLTNLCNCSCAMCSSHVHPEAYNVHRYLDWNTFATLLNQAKEMGVKVVAVGGGEPRLYPYLLHLLKHPIFLGDTQLSITTTEPTLLIQYAATHNLVDLVKAVEFHLSWDEDHSKGGFIRSNLVVCIEFLRSMGVRRVGINHVVTETEYLRQLVEISPLADQVVLLSRKPENWIVDERRVEYMTKKYEDLEKAPSLLLDACSDVEGCGQGKWSLHMDWNGNIGACSHQTNGRISYSRQSDLASVWEQLKEKVKNGECGHLGRHCPAKVAIKARADALQEMRKAG